MKKFVPALLAAALVVSAAGGAWASGLAPLSPEFLKWQEAQKNTFSVAEESGAARNYGVKPSPLNLTHLASNPVRVAADLPVSFDLRTWGVVPPVRDQALWGTCWAHATMAAVETNYLLQVRSGGENFLNVTSKDLNLSEMHLAWFTFMGPKLEQRLTNSRAKDIRSPTGYSALNEGGWADVSVMVMARGWGWGPVTEEAMPYLSRYLSTDQEIRQVVGDQQPGETEEEWNKRYEAEIERITNPWCSANLTGKKPSDYTSVLRLKEAAYVVNMGPGKNGYLDRMFKENRAGIKQLIMEKGALYISYNAGGTVSGDSYYYTGNKDALHAVALIGWDDNYPVENFTATGNGNARPNRPGAWLIRNSWGENAPGHNKGYFWMSYEQDMGMGTAFIMAQADSTLTTYTHSDLGWCDSWGDNKINSPFYGASVFKAGSSAVTLKEIGFYTTDNNASVGFSVYRYGATKPTAATLVAGQTAAATVPSTTYDYAGYHTVNCPDVTVGAGEYFAIVQRASNPTYGYPQAVMTKINNYSDFAQFYDGEGYTSSNGTEWFDGVTMTDEKNNPTPIAPCIYAIVTGAASGDEGEDTTEVTIDGIPVEDIENFARDINVNPSANATLNSEAARTGRSLTLTLAGTNGAAVAESQDFVIYLMYTNDLLHWDETESSKWGVRYPSGDIVPVYPTGYKPDLFIEYGIEDDFENILSADLPAYGPFQVTTGSGGKITLNVDNLVYADIGDVDNAGEKAKIPTGYHDLFYFSPLGDETAVSGVVEDLNLTGSSPEPTPDPDPTPTPSNSSSKGGSSGCSAGLGGLGLMSLVGLALFIKRR